MICLQYLWCGKVNSFAKEIVCLALMFPDDKICDVRELGPQKTLLCRRPEIGDVEAISHVVVYIAMKPMKECDMDLDYIGGYKDMTNYKLQEISRVESQSIGAIEMPFP